MWNTNTVIEVNEKEERTGPLPRIRRSRRRLTEVAEREIQLVMRSRLPEGGGPWTREHAHALIERMTGYDLPERTFGTYLARWGFHPLKPMRKAHRADPKTMKLWMSRDYPAIAFMARTEDAEILWLSQDLLPPLDPSGPNTHDRNAHARDHLIHVATNRGHLEWMVTVGAPNEAAIVDFMKMISERYPALHLIAPNAMLASMADMDVVSMGMAKGLRIHLLPEPAKRRMMIG